MKTLTAAEILKAALALPTLDRERIAMELWESVPPPGMLNEDDPGFGEELDRRAEAYRSGEMTASTWEEVDARLTARLDQERSDR